MSPLHKTPQRSRRARSAKVVLAKRLQFTSAHFFESGLFNGLRPFGIENFFSLLASPKGCISRHFPTAAAFLARTQGPTEQHSVYKNDDSRISVFIKTNVRLPGQLLFPGFGVMAGLAPTCPAVHAAPRRSPLRKDRVCQTFIPMQRRSDGWPRQSPDQAGRGP
jgi:hypothetical protein